MTQKATFDGKRFTFHPPIPFESTEGYIQSIEFLGLQDEWFSVSWSDEPDSSPRDWRPSKEHWDANLKLDKTSCVSQVQALWNEWYPTTLAPSPIQTTEPYAPDQDYINEALF